jgi:hypothetical protein
VNIRDTISHWQAKVMNSPPILNLRMPDVHAEVRAIYSRVSSFTMTSPERIVGLCEAVRYVVAAGIQGDFVECGVWRGGSSMAAAMSLMKAGDTERQLYLFDTFEGMSSPTEHDRRANDSVSAEALLHAAASVDKIWCRASFDDVAANMGLTGYPAEKVVLCKGKVEDTLPAYAPERIALLRLDTDWYESTRHELEQLYPRLAVGGVLIIDDYGYWAGARKAVDEYFTNRPVCLNRLDKTGRIVIKTK